MSSSGGRHQRLPQNDPDNGPPRQSRFHTIHDSAPSSNSSNSNGSAGAGGYYQGGGSPSCANCCTNCCNYLPLLCKILIFVFLGGLIATFFPAVYWNVVLYAQAVTGNPLNVYRIFVCTYFGQIVGALFAILHIFQDSAMLEHRKGTVWFLHLWFMVAIVVNSVFFLAMLVVSTFSDLFFVSHGPWPVLICMLPLSAKINSRDEYRVCFCNIPAKYYPWLVLVMLSLFSFSYSGIPALLIGLLLGYALVHFEDQVTLSMATLRRLESGALSCLTEQSGFVSTEAGASGNVPEPFSLQRMIMGGTAQAPPQAQAGGSSSGGRIYGSGVVGGGGSSSSSSSSSSGGRAGGYYGMPPDEIEPDTMMEEKENAAQTQSVFAAGGGHRLGGGTSTSSSSSAASRLTSLFGRSQAAPPPYAAATESAGSRAARIPTKGLNRLVENAYKQKGAPGGPAADVELDEVNGDSSSSLASTSVVSVSASRVPAVDSSPLLAGQIASDSDEVAIAVGPADGGREGHSDARERNVSRLAALGYSREDARNALVIADDDFEAARQFLSTPLTSSIATS